MTMSLPGIALHREPAGYRMEQSRPSVGPLLASLPLGQALEQVTKLLPICGEAQRIAARCAVQAARGEAEARLPEVPDVLLREQLQSSLWRFTVDWPALVGETQDLETLRHALRSREVSALRRLLRSQLDGLDRAETPGEVLDWMARGACTASRVLARARAIEEREGARFGTEDAEEDRRGSGDNGNGSGNGSACLSPSAVLERARNGSFWPVGDAVFDPPPGEVGARAMKRHVLAGSAEMPGGPLVTRLLAQALDAAFLVSAEAVSAGIGPADEPGEHTACSIPSANTGIGWAMTARGPLVHHVALEPGEPSRARRWDVLAPTDWHFGPDGPVNRALGTWERLPDADWVRFFVAGFDPCAAWSVIDPEGEG